MKRKLIIVIAVLSIVTGVIVAGCFFSDDDDPENVGALPCMCLINYSSTGITGLRYRVSGTSTWITRDFGITIVTNGGIDCPNGTFASALPAGTYDFEFYSSGGGTVRGWTSDPYAGGNIGFQVTDNTGTSVYTPVDNNCNSIGNTYYADY